MKARDTLRSEDSLITDTRSIRPRVRYVGVVAAMMLVVATARTVAAASLTPLGFLPGQFRSVANGVSADGSTVVGFSGLGAGQEAFRWTSDGGMVGLGDLSGGMFESSANGVSADGSVIVGSGNRGDTAATREAFSWTSDGGMVGLGDLAGGAFLSEAYRVSADGSVVVGWGVSASGSQALRWTTDGGMVGLGDPLGGHSFGAAYGITGDSSVIVGAGYSPNGTLEAVRWTSDGGTVGLGLLPGAGVDSAAFGVSADGAVVVGYGRRFLGGGFQPNLEAFRWTSGDGMVGLGDLPGGLFESYAFDVSGDGSTVIGYGSTAFGTEAFLWTSDVGMKRLWSVLLAQGIDPTADGWTDLTVASGISADSNTIVGWGTRDGNTEAFIAILDELLVGDTNDDGVVDLNDLNNVRNNFGATGEGLPGDTNNDLIVDLDDLNAVRNNFGAAGNAQPVPEPPTIAMVVVALIGFCVSSQGRVRRRSAPVPH